MKVNGSIVLFHNDVNKIKKVIYSFFNSNEENLINKLYLIDNSSNDDLKELALINENIEYIFNNKNLGYGKAHNIAFNKSIENNIPYHIVLNPDVEFVDIVISELVKYADKNEDVGHIMPNIVYPSGERQLLTKMLPTPMQLIFRRFIPIKSIKEKLDFDYEMKFLKYDKIVEAPTLSGCFMFLRTSVLKEIGGFDDRYFMYLEDVDLTRTIGEKYKTIMYPFVNVIHHYEKGSYKSKILLKYHIQSAISYFNKWGWIFDSKRYKINKDTLNKYKREI